MGYAICGSDYKQFKSGREFVENNCFMNYYVLSGKFAGHLANRKFTVNEYCGMYLIQDWNHTEIVLCETGDKKEVEKYDYTKHDISY